MKENKIQEYCEKVEEIINYECKHQRLTLEEFNKINKLLFELTINGIYNVNEYMKKRK